MKATHRTKTLTASIGAKHTPDEETCIKQAAEQAGLTVSEWCRRAHLEALDVSRGERILLQELLACRRVMLRLTLTTKQVTEQHLKEFIDQAEAVKRSMAESRINSMRSCSHD
ncbi:MAG: plasmid mobilization protein [Bryobacteraceae bacterium]